MTPSGSPTGTGSTGTSAGGSGATTPEKGSKLFSVEGSFSYCVPSFSQLALLCFSYDLDSPSGPLSNGLVSFRAIQLAVHLFPF